MYQRGRLAATCFDVGMEKVMQSARSSKRFGIWLCHLAWQFVTLSGVACVIGCGGGGLGAPKEVVVYTALDQDFSQPIFAEFTKETGIAVRRKFDTESTKTVGLVQRIIGERERPRCDLFWNNEILNTLRLEREGLLRPYRSPQADAFPASVRSPDGMWYGFAARARILVVNTNQVPEERRPKSIRDLTDPQWYERCGIAKPLFGTTATHAVCLFSAWGDAEAKEFFDGVKRNARIMSGNKQVAEAVAAGTLAFGLTDTDDALVEIERGMPVAIVYPDQEEGQVGTLFIPNTLALIKGSPHPQAAEKLVDYLLSGDVERRLADGPSGQIPLRKGVAASPRVKTPNEVRAMEVDWKVAAAKWDTVAEFLKAEFTAP
jgi:iron(III) transport system substrate-binding protein